MTRQVKINSAKYKKVAGRHYLTFIGETVLPISQLEQTLRVHLNEETVAVHLSKTGETLFVEVSSTHDLVEAIVLFESDVIYRLQASQLAKLIKKSSRIKYHIDTKVVADTETEYVLHVNGWAIDLYTGQTVDFKVQLDDTLFTDYHVTRLVRPDLAKYLQHHYLPEQVGYHLVVRIPKTAEFSELKVFAIGESTTEQIVTLPKKRVLRYAETKGTVRYHIDALTIEDEQDGMHTIQLTGWRVCLADDAPLIDVQDAQGQSVAAKIVYTEREDLVDALHLVDHQKAEGFTITISLSNKEQVTIAYGKRVRQTLSYASAQKLKKTLRYRNRVNGVVHQLNADNLRKTVQSVKTYGLSQTLTKVWQILRHGSIGLDYAQWYATHQPTEQELDMQRQHVFAYAPKISIVVPTYKTPEPYLREMIDTVRAQTYTNWELCIAEASLDDSVVNVLREYTQQDERIRYTVLTENYGISGNTNKAIEMAKGEYVALYDHDDTLPPNTLYEVVLALQDTQHDVLYTDEDKVNAKGTVYSGPHFKPDFSLDLLRSVNYITHFFIVKRSVIDKVGMLNAAFDGAQDYDFIFRCTEVANSICHIPKILYHWRIHDNSTAGNPNSKLYAYTAGKRAIEAHYERMGIQAKVEQQGFISYRSIYDVSSQPKISIIIPSKDHIDDLDKCVQSIYQHSTYRHFEFIIVENNSTEEATFAYYKQMEAAHDNFKVVYWQEGFNYAAINNFGASFATGDYYLLLNNDVALMSEDALADMLGYCMQDNVGAVGAKLFYQDDTIQHAGIVVGAGGAAGHVFTGLKDDEYGYMAHTNMVCNYSAVTAACLMVPKAVFAAVGGLTEAFVVAYNDVDFCLKIVEKGYRVVYDAYAKWHHYESKSRGYEDTPEKKERFEKEKALLRNTWKDFFIKGDPMYNPNFSLSHPFALVEKDVWREDVEKMKQSESGDQYDV